MKLNSLSKNQKALIALMVCAGYMAVQPMTAMADDSVASVQAVQQKQSVSGVVKDAAGEPIIGASVLEKGTTNGTITDFDGNFQLSVSPNATLVISYIGYQTQELKVVLGKSLAVTMQEDTETLDEVVVVGFGTQKKVNLTGSVAVADKKLLEQRPVNNAITALQGVIPGLNITTSGLGGMLDNDKTIDIRGAGTVGDQSSGAPLILIDGMEGDLNAVNPQDIESISVLKDAAASSIYGSRAPFGVVLVTTKNGNEGKPVINYNNSFRYKTPLHMPDQMNSVEFISYNNDAYGNNGMKLVDGKYVPGNGRWSEQILQNAKDYMAGTLIDPRTGEFNPLYTSGTDGSGWWDGNNGWANHDWLDMLYKDWTPAQEHNISISGGTKKLNYYFSANYMDEDGTLNYGTENMKRYTVTGKFSSQLTDYLKLDFSTRFTRSDYDRPTQLGQSLYDNVMRRAYPTRPLYDGNGFKDYDFNYAWVLEDGGRTGIVKDAINNQIKATITPLKNWNIIGEFNFRIQNHWTHTENVYLEKTHSDGLRKTKGALSNSYSSIAEEAYNAVYLNPNVYSNYHFTLDNVHNFAATVGFQSESFEKKNVKASRGDLTSWDVPVLDQTTSKDNDRISIAGELQKWRTVGFFGRINYDYDGKYLVEANLRYDGTSRFRRDSRWVWTPSFSLGWNIARESFWEKYQDKINTLKLRASWGTLANQNTNGWYPTYATIELAQTSWLVNGSQANTAKAPGLISPTLTWEKIYTTNIGLDWGAFNNRLTGSFDYFIRETRDIVGAGVELPAILGVAVPNTNNTDLRTYGWELQVSWRDQIEDFSYGATLSLSDSQTKILKYPNPTNRLDKYREGEVTGNIYGFISKGIAKTQEEMDAHLASLPNGGQSEIAGTWYAGDMMYVDVDGDGKISKGANTRDNCGDLVVIGNQTPRYRFGLSLDAAWKGFDVQMFFQGVLKRDYYLNNMMFFGFTGGGEWWSTYLKPHLDYWRDENSPLGPNPDAYYARPYRSGTNARKNQDTPQTRYLQDASYMRLKNLTIGYTLPRVLTQKLGIEKVRVYASGENLWTLSHIKDNLMDPEQVGIGSYGASYPLSQTYAFGLSVTF